jgi:hypothetical protein
MERAYPLSRVSSDAGRRHRRSLLHRAVGVMHGLGTGPRIGSVSHGRPVTQHLEAGMVAYRAVGSGTVPHAITSLGDRPDHHFVVELLPPNESIARIPRSDGLPPWRSRRGQVPGCPRGDRRRRPRAAVRPSVGRRGSGAPSSGNGRDPPVASSPSGSVGGRNPSAAVTPASARSSGGGGALYVLVAAPSGAGIAAPSTEGQMRGAGPWPGPMRRRHRLMAYCCTPLL